MRLCSPVAIDLSANTHGLPVHSCAFNTMIDGMNKMAMPAVTHMLQTIYGRMREYSVHEVTELRAVFYFSARLKPALNDLSGYARREALGGLHTGMGQFLLERDGDCEV